jgi:hypothetical protein
MASDCHGNGADHCCYFHGPCPFLETDTVSGRHWVCGLRRELGSWDLVHTDPRYLTTVKPVWIENGVDDCGEFRGTGRLQCCFADDHEVTFNIEVGPGRPDSMDSQERGRQAGYASSEVGVGIIRRS